MLKELTLLKEKRRLQCEQSLYLFNKDAFEVLHNREKLEDNWHIEYICNRLQKEIQRITKGEKREKNIIINIPPRSLKSEMITVFLTAWAWIHNPSLKIITSSYSKDLSVDHNVMTRRVIESEWYQYRWSGCYKLTSDVNTKSRFENNLDGFRQCTSTGSTITGKGGDIIIIDDSVNPKRAMSERMRKEANDFYDYTLSTRLNNPDIGVFIVVMQRLHDMDLTGHLLKKGNDWELINIPGEETADIQPKELKKYYKDGLFFPKRFTRKYLDSLKKTMGSFGYAGQILQNPTPEGGGLIKKQWFKIFTMSDIEAQAERLKKKIVWNFTFDGAYTESQLNDPSAILAYCYFEGGMYIRATKSVWKEFPELIPFIKEFVKDNGYTSSSSIRIEPKASGLSAAQVLKRTTELNIIIDKAPIVDKIARVKEALPFVESGRVYLLADSNWSDSFIYQCAGFPNAEHDDEVDCFTIAVKQCQGGVGSVIKRYKIFK